MIFLIKDYLDWRSINGRYTPFSSSNLESWHYQKHIPKDVLALLSDGDIILSANYNSKISWIIMYLTDSLYSHAAIYSEDGNIMHSTTKGVLYEPLRNYFGLGRVFLPISFSGKRPKDKKLKNFYINNYTEENRKKYNYRKVILIGLSTVLCLHPQNFKKNYFFDLSIVTLPLSAALGYFGLQVIALLLVGTLSVIGLYRVFLFRRHGYVFYVSTPGGFSKYALRSQEFTALINAKGFQRYMINLARLIEKDQGELKAGTTYKIPKGARVKIRQ